MKRLQRCLRLEIGYHIFVPPRLRQGRTTALVAIRVPPYLMLIRFRETYSGLINTASKYPMAYPRNTQHLVV